MKLNTVDELIRFNDLLDQCKGYVCLHAPDGRYLDLSNKATRLQGLAALSGKDADYYELFAGRREDEHLLICYLLQQEKKTA